MGTITTGVGLLSGLPIDEIITQLMQIEARPLQQTQARLEEVQAQRTAFLELNARILAIKNAATRFDEASYFRSTKAVSSNTNVLTATAGSTTTIGAYTFHVHSLVSNHQSISNGFADADSTPVGAGIVAIEFGKGALNPATSLDLLNDQDGVERGTIRITDRSGRTADVDLTTALTVEDVLEAINARVDVGVTASVSGDHIVLTDRSGGTGAFSVMDLGGRHTASDLGIAASVTEDTITGSAVLALGMGTRLGVLNDGNGIRRDGSLDDFEIGLASGKRLRVNLSGRLEFSTRLEQLNSGQGVRLGVIRVTDRQGDSAEIDLTGAQTLQDVFDRLTAQEVKDQGVDLTMVIRNSSLMITDTSVPEGESSTSNFVIEDVSGHAAQDLGIAFDADERTVSGHTIHRINTVGDVIRAINYAREVDASGQDTGNYNDGDLVASVSADGRIILTDNTGSGTTITALNDSQAAADLGIMDAATGAVTSERILAGLNTVLLKSLNGGRGVSDGAIRITAGDGTITDIDVSGAETVQDVLDLINATTETSKVTAELNDSAIGLVIRDGSGGPGLLTIANSGGGSTADDLGIATSGVSGVMRGGNLQLQYVNEATKLSDLNAGQGIREGTFRITDGAGASTSVTIDLDDVTTVGDVIARINAGAANVAARINDTGDGILVEDLAGGNALTIEDVSGRAAEDLHLAGTAKLGDTTIDGSFELRIDIDSDDTLRDVAEKIDAASDLLSASIINDGSPVNGYRLSINSQVSGTPGKLLLDGGGTNLSFDTLTEAQDAVVFFGDPSSPNAIRIVSPTNTIRDFVDGLTLELKGTSDDPVSVSVSRDVDKMVSDINTFVETFNDVLDRIDELTSFNEETYERGLLFGDATIAAVQRRLYSIINTTVPGVDSQYNRLNDVGLTLANGAKLEFDEQRFREAYGQDPEGVVELFTHEVTVTNDAGQSETQKLGLGHRIDAILKELTAPATGRLAQEGERLRQREELFNDRIDSLQTLLDGKEARLRARFQAMEQALAMLQQQQSALGSLTNLLPTS
jgi:flagellar hook-associated protein 2